MPTGTRPITNTEDIIDSRDIIARIEYLENIHAEECPDDCEMDHDEHDTCCDEDEHEELVALKALAEEAGDYSSDWHHGAALIADYYFEQFAEEEAESIGAINPQAAPWPLNHIDWKAAAEELQQDYTQIDFDGVDYWIRTT